MNPSKAGWICNQVQPAFSFGFGVRFAGCSHQGQVTLWLENERAGELRTDCPLPVPLRHPARPGPKNQRVGNPGLIARCLLHFGTQPGCGRRESSGTQPSCGKPKKRRLSYIAGKAITNTAPPSGALNAVTLPSKLSAISFTMASPSPAPPL